MDSAQTGRWALRRRRPQAGATLIELMVGAGIMAVVLALAVPSFAEWITNTRVRSTSEALQTGLQMARAEAVRRNAIVRFQLTTAVDNSCALSSSGVYWVINVGAANSPAGACGNAVSDTKLPYIVQVSPGGSSVNNVVVASTVRAVGFNGLGRQVAIDGVEPADQTISVSVSADRGSCAPGGAVRCLRVLVGAAGQIRMCDPARQVAGDPMRC